MSKKTFLIQTDILTEKAGHPPFLPWDFSYELVNQIKGDSRVREDFDYGLYSNLDALFELSETEEFKGAIKDCIPVGSVDFVHSFIDRVYGFTPSPLYIPDELKSYLGRYVHFYCDVNFIDKLIRSGAQFVKTANHVKGYNDIISDVRELEEYKKDYATELYHSSGVIDIESEWRVFVHRGKVLDCRNYSGDPMVFPNRWMVESMVEDFKSAPIAYTLDVAVTSGGDTVVIETHRFYSCGTYGFSSPKLPYMLSQAFFEIVRENGKVD